MACKKKVLKTAALTAVGAAAGTAALAGIVSVVAYECMLDIRFAAKIGEKFSAAMEKEKQEAASSAAEITPPDNETYNRNVALWLEKHTAEDLFLVNEKGQKRHAKFFDNGHPEKWVIIFHGYTSDPCGMYHYAYPYAEMGFNCILPSMIGHGKDENRYCSMGYHDRYMGIDWIDYILLQNPDAEIVLHGESMGAATTMLITGEHLPKNVKAAVEDCGFTSCYKEYVHVTKKQMHPALVPLLPVISKYSVLRGNFDFRKCAPVEAVKFSETPTLFIHGEADDFVPFSMMDEVYKTCGAKKEKFSVPGADHARSSTYNPVLYWTNVHAFIRKFVKS